MKTIGAFEAKTHLSRLLREVEQGEVVVITRKNKPIARLSPFSDTSSMDPKAAVLALRALREKIQSDDLSISEMIAQGRRF